jgi:replication factor C subunit 1
MDEIDGMSGGDRGGGAELAKYCRLTKIPIICICNDKWNNKVKNVSNYCFDLKFQKPAAAQVAKRLI